MMVAVYERYILNGVNFWSSFCCVTGSPRARFLPLHLSGPQPSTFQKSTPPGIMNSLLLRSLIYQI